MEASDGPVRFGFKSDLLEAIEVVECTWGDCRSKLDKVLKAHPVVKVKLLDKPELGHVSQGDGTYYFLETVSGRQAFVHHYDKAWIEYKEIAQEVLEKLWPGIKFELP